MSKLSYQLSVKRYQRKLGLDARTFNALDVKHDDINLLKQLQLLNPIRASSALALIPLGDTGFYGSLTITNQTSGVAKSIQVKLAFNDVEIASYITINGGSSQTLNLPIGSRLPNPASNLQLKLIGATGVTQIDAAAFDGFTPTNLTNNALTSENTLSMLVNSNFITNGAMSLTLLVVSPPPPPANTGWYGKLDIVNQDTGLGGRYFTFIASDATGTINVSEQYVYPNDTYTIEVLIGNRLPNMNSIITFEIVQFQQDSYDYENAYINGATYTGTLYSQAYITAGTAGGTITITIPVANNI